MTGDAAGARRCGRPSCFAPDTSCDIGHVDLAKCPNWASQEAAGPPVADRADGVLLPWSGSALGLADLGFVAGRARPLVVGIVGPQNSGKTTLLGAWYLLLGRGVPGLANCRFAGSFTLAGWEAVAGCLRWSPGQPPNFPPHTTSRGGRAPGLLHLSFQDTEQSRPMDFLLTDAPGEWFQRWAVSRDSDEAAGARWIAEHADAFLLVADREALADAEHMGRARGSVQRLAARLADERRGRPVALVWTKADVPVAVEMERSIRERVQRLVPDVVEFAVSVVSGLGPGGAGPDGPGPDPAAPDGVGTGLVDLLRWVVKVRRPRVELPSPSATRDDPLFRFRVAS